ncbi:hypothetical protein HPB52_002071 [Rhipicephalus sanguineus]|uniref:Uncharacterized protein n=1 Tax=Rhipicephalus sanguineus TaxID=34632 RepID=A0A9D4SQJ6_RHISA|nr:hypothetical protein HPB52_002071 [Rhipicephalus sanguineus]
MIREQKTAYANIAQLLNDNGECLNPRNVFNASINFNRVKSAAQVEAEVRDTLRGTGLQCISCEVRDSSLKFDSLDTILDILLTVFPFKDFVSAEEWEDFRNLWAEVLYPKLSPTPEEQLALKFTYYLVHARRSTD